MRECAVDVEQRPLGPVLDAIAAGRAFDLYRAAEGEGHRIPKPKNRRASKSASDNAEMTVSKAPRLWSHVN